MFRVISYNNKGNESLKFNFSICPEVSYGLLRFNLLQLKTSKSILTFSVDSSFGIFNDGIPSIIWDDEYPLIEMMGQVDEKYKDKNKILFVSSKDGTPIKIYYGQKITFKETEFKNLTHLIIDGMDMYLYNLSFTILAKNNSLSLV